MIDPHALNKTAYRLAYPRGWRRRTRRLFVITFPLSAGIWLLSLMGLGLAMLVLDLARALERFCNAPARGWITYNISLSAPRHDRLSSGRGRHLTAGGRGILHAALNPARA